VSEIYEKGHEIASHGYSHKLLYDLGREKFEDDVKRSVDLLESITGERTVRFRAPRFSINNSTKWAFEILKKYGFKYDSSIYPIRTKFYGVPNAPLQPYRPSVEDITKHDPNGDVIEFPLTVLKFVKIIPISGGFYLRILPFSALRFAIESVNKIRPAIVYIHPWETYNGNPRLTMPPFPRFVNRYGVRSALKKFEGLVAFFKFKPVREVLNGI
jgi:polysaccharide deacetylase family protein (PEP-CTERM system associated)